MSYVLFLKQRSVTLNKGILNQSVWQAFSETEEHLVFFLKYNFYVHLHSWTSVFILAAVCPWALSPVVRLFLCYITKTRSTSFLPFLHASSTYTHPLLFMGLYFAVLQIPRIKIDHLDLSVDRSIRIVWQFKQVFMPYHVISKELKEKKTQLPLHCFSKKRKTLLKYYNIVFFWREGVGGGCGCDGAVNLQIFAFCRGSWNPTLRKSEGWV